MLEKKISKLQNAGLIGSYCRSTRMTLLFGNIHVDNFIQLQTKFDLIETLHKEREREWDVEKVQDRER